MEDTLSSASISKRTITWDMAPNLGLSVSIKNDLLRTFCLSRFFNLSEIEDINDIYFAFSILVNFRLSAYSFSISCKWVRVSSIESFTLVKASLCFCSIGLGPLNCTAPTDDMADMDIAAAHKTAISFLNILIFILNINSFL